jgi:glycosyltransferase involved in cell wall biosynthesis
MSVAPYVRALVAQVVCGSLSWRHYARLPALPPALDARATWPRVSIVVPARDEEARLPALLRSLATLDYPDYDVIVVDDESGDDTAALAARAGARVVQGTPLPVGWTGKSHACAQGADVADGALLLFTDADTVHEPASLRAAVAYLEREDLGALSLITGQRCETFFERLLLPTAYAMLFAGISPRRVNRPRHISPLHISPLHTSPLANGQYILCRRAAYEQAGGHATVRGSIIEDAALARALSRAGVRYRLCRAESLVSVRMYGGLGELWAGFRKNAARYVLDDPRRLPTTALYSAALGTALPLLIRAIMTPGKVHELLDTGTPSARRTRVHWAAERAARGPRGTPAGAQRVGTPGARGRAGKPRGPRAARSAAQWTRRRPIIHEPSAPGSAWELSGYGRAVYPHAPAVGGVLGGGISPGSPGGALDRRPQPGGQSAMGGGGERRSGSCHGLLRPGPLALALAGYLAGVVGLVPWYRRFGVPARYATLYPLAVGIFGLITADSTWRLLARRGAAWKGRTYR